MPSAAERSDVSQLREVRKPYCSQLGELCSEPLSELWRNWTTDRGRETQSDKELQ